MNFYITKEYIFLDIKIIIHIVHTTDLHASILFINFHHTFWMFNSQNSILKKLKKWINLFNVKHMNPNKFFKTSRYRFGFVTLRSVYVHFIVD